MPSENTKETTLDGFSDVNEPSRAVSHDFDPLPENLETSASPNKRSKLWIPSEDDTIGADCTNEGLRSNQVAEDNDNHSPVHANPSTSLLGSHCQAQDETEPVEQPIIEDVPDQYDLQALFYYVCIGAIDEYQLARAEQLLLDETVEAEKPIDGSVSPGGSNAHENSGSDEFGNVMDARDFQVAALVYHDAEEPPAFEWILLEDELEMESILQMPRLQQLFMQEPINAKQFLPREPLEIEPFSLQEPIDAEQFLPGEPLVTDPVFHEETFDFERFLLDDDEDELEHNEELLYDDDDVWGMDIQAVFEGL